MLLPDTDGGTDTETMTAKSERGEVPVQSIQSQPKVGRRKQERRVKLARREGDSFGSAKVVGYGTLS